MSDLTDIGIYLAANQGISDADHAKDALDQYDTGDRAENLIEAQEMIDQFVTGVQAMPLDLPLIQIIGLIDNPFVSS